VNSKTIFFLGVIIAASGVIPPWLALIAGVIFALCCTHHYQADAKALSHLLLQASVVGLGFGMNLHEVLRAGSAGFAYTAVGITLTMTLGVLLGRLLNTPRHTTLLIAAGTAICGGSAIAALASILNPKEEETSVSLGAVFMLNSVALLLFPAVGLALHMSQWQFGLWAALAIHDTSSVVGASAHYGAEALQIATSVKLARALWIVPLSLLMAFGQRGKAKIRWPWFILFFCAAALVNTVLPQGHAVYATLSLLGRSGLTVVLFLIGSGLSRKSIASVGWRPLALGLMLWVIVGSLSLLAILRGLISV